MRLFSKTGWTVAFKLIDTSKPLTRSTAFLKG